MSETTAVVAGQVRLYSQHFLLLSRREREAGADRSHRPLAACIACLSISTKTPRFDEFCCESRPSNMPSFTIQQCAIPAVTFLIGLIAYPSLWLLRRLGPHPLTEQQTIILHVYAVVIIYCYYKACFTDPGRISKDWVPIQSDTVKGKDSLDERQRQRWCRKCQAYKPPRAHHCKTCERFVAS